MPKFLPENFSFVADGKIIELHNATSDTFSLNKALLDPKKFKDFAQDPKQFAATYNLSIDDDIATKLAERLKGIPSHDAMTVMMRDGSGATAWAVAAGSYSVASSKIAVAY